MSRLKGPMEPKEAASAQVSGHTGRGTPPVPLARTAWDGPDDDPWDFDTEDHIIRGID